MDSIVGELVGTLRNQLQEREAQLAAACEANTHANQQVQRYLTVCGVGGLGDAQGGG